MSATPLLRNGSRSNRPRASIAAWAMWIVVIAIAMISFAVDQGVVSTLAAGDDLGKSLGESGPVQLIRSLIDTAIE